MKKSLVVLIILFLGICIISLAQSGYEDVVYLKNGSIIHGMIVEQVPNQSIKIKTHDGNIFFYKMEEVEKMTKEADTKSTAGRNSGYTNITEVYTGFPTGESTASGIIFGVQTINGYLFNPNISLGLGVGFHAYNKRSYLPLFLDLRTYFTPGAVTPFINLAGGYALSLNAHDGAITNKGGMILNPGFGVKFMVAPKLALDFSFGYMHQEYTVTYDYSYYGYSYNYYYFPETYTYKSKLDFVTFKFGLTY
jgi:hypothetical protein